ncbi:hypothetical protein RchiOBHm_Chr4g0387991 [Rosa chinensis]|uniref:Uncharacterized protein n=1 Tax=Rosa chinensis TaxID=74649 RepID=A0A2P6QPM1_ROSCH|nr:hypothetical protein RchiOBHm_Chr4g0387991 [Rosa chinensis]
MFGVYESKCSCHVNDPESLVLKINLLFLDTYVLHYELMTTNLGVHMPESTPLIIKRSLCLREV